MHDLRAGSIRILIRPPSTSRSRCRTSDVDRPPDRSTMNPKKRCVVDDCDRPHHGRGYCGPHYQEWRRTGERPDHDWIRESWQEQQLLLGFTGEGVGYPFEDEAEERKAWERRRAEWEQKWKRPARSHTPGSRPAAWWKFIAGRPHRVLHWPSHDHLCKRCWTTRLSRLSGSPAKVISRPGRSTRSGRTRL